MLWLTVWSLWQAASQVNDDYDDVMNEPMTYPFLRQHHRIYGPSYPQS